MLHRLPLFMQPPKNLKPTMVRLLALVVVLLPLLTHLYTTAVAASDSSDVPHGFIQRTNPADGAIFSGGGKEKLVHLQFFWHNTFNEPNPTAVSVARSPTTNDYPSLFGLVNVFDDPLTVGPSLSSARVGSSQGMYVSADQKTQAVLMAMNFVLAVGKYNGSTFTVMGRNELPLDVREMPIIGGSGLFRFARGYVKASTYSMDGNTGYVTVQYNCSVLYPSNLMSDL